jgi:hypothetical protein
MIEVKSVNLDSIGGIVSTELHGMCSWMGETVTFWGRFDCNGDQLRRIPLVPLRKHLIDAVDAEGERPEGYIRCTAFARPQ